MRSSNFRAGPPRKVTTFASGTGTFVPLAGSTWRLETLVSAGGGGAGGASNGAGQGGTGGQAGAMSQVWVPNDGNSKTYQIGAKGLAGSVAGAGTPGGATSLGPTTVAGGAGAKAISSSNIPYSPAFCGQSSPFGGYGRGGDGGVPGTAGQDGTGGFIMIEEY